MELLLHVSSEKDAELAELRRYTAVSPADTTKSDLSTDIIRCASGIVTLNLLVQPSVLLLHDPNP